MQDYKTKLITAKTCDIGIKENIMNNICYFELYYYFFNFLRLGLDREQLNSKIPVKSDTNSLKNCEEAKALASEIEEFDKLKAKVIDLVAKIFSTLNDDNIIPQMLQVLQKKTSEIAVFNENKLKYENMLKELESLQTSINDCKTRLQQKNEVFLKVKSHATKPNEQNEKVNTTYNIDKLYYNIIL